MDLVKVVIIGAKGMLGSDLVDTGLKVGLEVTGLDLPECDITDPASLSALLPDADWVVNCAAYTRVDDAEREREKAFAVNSEGVRNLAQICRRRAIRMLHISTDYVFDGRSEQPYTETDRVSPINVYGASKLAGEKALKAEGLPFLIVRTQSLFGAHGPNFVRAIATKLQKSTEPLTVVSDQISSPTYTLHLAEALVRLLRSNEEGIVHVTASGSCSWYDLACRIVEAIRPGHPVHPITSATLKRPAMRPPYSVLNNSRYTAWTNHALPSWEEGLLAYLKEESFI